MESFVVSARKYRPATFDTVVGQKSITNTLKNAIRNQTLAHAFLFCGPRGVGKTTCARIFAKTINCEHLTENMEACDKCPSCVSFNNSSSFNVHELDAASNNSVDDIRSLVDQVRIPPQMGRYKVYIIDEVHMLSSSAFNAFLKTLEEPPAYAKFILATTEKHKIIPTILSRCQIFDFSRITIEDIARHLQYVADSEGITAEYDALHIIAQKADGALRDALSIFDQIVSFAGQNITYKDVIENLNVLDYDYYFKLTDYLLQHDITQTLLLTDEVISKGFEGSHFISGYGGHLRNLLVCKNPATVKLLEVGDNIRQKYLQQASACNEGFLIKALDINTKSDNQYRNSNNKRLTLELGMLQICSLNTSFDPSKGQGEIPRVASVPPQSQPAAATVQIQATPPLAQAAIPAPVVELVSKPVVPASGVVIKKQGTVSISGIKSQNLPSEEEKKKSEQSGVAEEETGPVNQFSQESLEKAWNDFAKKLEQDCMNLYVTLTSRTPVLKENFVVDFLVDNIIQSENINEQKRDLLAYLRKELNNFKISLEIHISETVIEKKAYTPIEKYQKLLEKNPELQTLKQKLDLDFNYG